ncbi:hypothetical protein [Mesorhizobium sp. RIZ17]|uniref:hypothetical protein n=1 Tax=Mesorhizobium sp. RIZ17 TaxID=3132743 RepID=UPI003DA84C8B
MKMMSVLGSHHEFRKRLEALLSQFAHVGTGAASETGISSNKLPHTSLSKRAIAEYDYNVGKVDSDWFGARKVGYLAAYVDFFGPRFSYERLEFSDGYIHPDLANMKTHLKFGCITPGFNGNFVLTEKGRALIAPFVIVTDAAMEAANAG